MPLVRVRDQHTSRAQNRESAGGEKHLECQQALGEPHIMSGDPAINPPKWPTSPPPDYNHQLRSATLCKPVPHTQHLAQRPQSPHTRHQPIQTLRRPNGTRLDQPGNIGFTERTIRSVGSNLTKPFCLNFPSLVRMSSSPPDANTDKALSRSEKRAAVRFATFARKSPTDNRVDESYLANSSGIVSSNSSCNRSASY